MFVIFLSYFRNMKYINYTYVCYITDLYHVHSNTADLLRAALSWLPVAIQQFFALSSSLFVDFLCILQRENLVRIMQLLTWTPA